MLTLVRRARRRVLQNELLTQGANALSAALAGFILLLILGTEILNWYWMVVIPAAALAAVFYRLRKRLPSLYATAQIIDRRLGLADAISTAVFFDSEPEAKTSPVVRRLQREQADRVSRGADLRRAIPYAVPRTVYPLAALVLVASSLFALRYGLTRRLDLREPMARLLAQSLGLDGPGQRAKLNPREKPNGARPMDQDNTADAQQDPGRDPSADPDQISNDSLADNADPQPSTSAAKLDKNGNAKGQQPQSQDASDARDSDGSQSDANQDAAQNGSPKKGSDQPSSNGNSNSPGSSSLLSKMKEAMQNLLSSMKQPPSDANSQQQNSSAQNSKQSKGQQGNKQEAKKGDRQNAGEQANAQDAQQSEQADGQDAPGQSKEKGAPQTANKQPGNGIGSRDGSKDVKQAEQLAAMGKITEIIGKRSANLSGEATVEVQSTAQQLRTQYSARQADHTEASGEISRDEIPVNLESYVEQYFEQVRKQPAPKK